VSRVLVSRVLVSRVLVSRVLVSRVLVRYSLSTVTLCIAERLYGSQQIGGDRDQRHQ
jgi:hypothetical protein